MFHLKFRNILIVEEHCTGNLLKTANASNKNHSVAIHKQTRFILILFQNHPQRYEKLEINMNPVFHISEDAFEILKHVS